MRKTKIICTMGPSTDKDDVMEQLVREGMDVARFNFSHGDYAYHQECLELVRKTAKELNLPVAAMMDAFVAYKNNRDLFD